MKRWRLVFGALLVVLGFWLISWNRVATWLERDAAQRETEWTQASGPWHWALDRGDHIVWPGSHGLADMDSRRAGAVGEVPNGVAEFSLALRGGRIDLALVDSIVLWADFEAPARLIILGDSDQDTLLISDHQIDAGDQSLSLPIASHRTPALHGLRVRVETTPASRIALRHFALLPPLGIVVSPCEATGSVQDTLDACDARVARLRAPAHAMPETALLWRDDILEQRPGAVVRAPAAIPTWDPFAARIRATPSLEISLAIALVMVPLLGATISRLTPAPSRRRAAIELGAVFLPWVAILWFGWPSDDTDAAISLVLLASIVSALLLRSLASDWQVWGDARAWQAIGLLTLAALPLIAATATANALDHDGLVLRSLSPEKFWQYPLWVLLQQLLLMRVIAPRLRFVTGSDVRGAMAAGALFGLLHLPNLSLMLATFIAGSAWAWLGLRHRALLPLVASHIVLGLAWLWIAPTWLLRSAEIGGRYLMAP
jgi:hypothetical protein